MKRSIQEIVELVVFAVIALLVASRCYLACRLARRPAGARSSCGSPESSGGCSAGLFRLSLSLSPIYALCSGCFSAENQKRAEKPAHQPIVSGPRSSGAPVADAQTEGSSSSASPSTPSGTGRPAGTSPAAAPVTTPPPVTASGEPVSPLGDVARSQLTLRRKRYCVGRAGSY